MRSQAHGSLEDSNLAAGAFDAALSSISAMHPGRASILFNLSTARLTSYQLSRNLVHLERGISASENAVLLAPDGCALRASYLCTLSSSLLSRFEHLEESADLDRAVSTAFEVTVTQTPEGHSQRCALFNNLADTLLARFQQWKDSDDLDLALTIYQDAIGFAPSGHPHHAA
jgi:tetratricopeptide (TPR) repeat protein